MSAYPLDIDAVSTVEASDNSVIDVAGDGTPKVRRLWDGISYQLTLVSGYISDADKGTLEAFYATNKALAVEVDFLNDEYSAYFSGPPQFVYLAGSRWIATSQMVGIKV